MRDLRHERLAEIIIRHSTRLAAGENILIEAIDIPAEMVIALMRAARCAGGHPFVSVKQNAILRELYVSSEEEAMRRMGEWEALRMSAMQAYVGLRGSLNSNELADVPDAGMKRYQKHWWMPVHLRQRIPGTRWVVLRWPHPSMAQAAQMSSEAFENFYFDVCTMDYGRMARAMQPLIVRLQSTDRVHITGPGTDLHFSIKGIPVHGASGEYNLPDGEVYTAPVRDSVNGRIHYTAPTIYRGIVHSDVTLVIRDGRIIEAASDKTRSLNEILDCDEGARYFGEFALGINPYITRPMLDILFDEKIAGSFHFTPGNALENACNGNQSQVHWDMVCIQTPEYGGGEIRFDGELIRRDGRFVPDDLQPLNPENLLGGQS